MCSSLDVAAVPGVSLAVLQAAVVETETTLQRLQARRATLLAELAHRGGGLVPDRDGAPVPLRIWLRDATGMPLGTARRACDVADGLDALPAVRDAVAAGELRADRAEVLATRLVPAVPADALTAAQEPLLTAAKLCEPATLAARIRSWVADHLPDTFADQEARVDRWLQIDATAPGSWRIHGQLDATAVETLRTALRPLETRDGATDRRPGRTRRADALVELARRSLDAGTLPDTGGARPQISVVVTDHVLAGRPGPAPRADRTGAITRPDLLALACDADLHIAHLDHTGRLLALHSPSRTVNLTLRRALTARDGGCVHHGCDTPAAACHAHHLTHWADGGATSIDNLALLCPRHHAAWHRGHLPRHHLRLPGDPPPTQDQRTTLTWIGQHRAPPPDDPPF